MIDQLLLDIEDKSQNFTTTSKKFKKDLWNFFQKDNGRYHRDLIAVEYGTHKGQTTRILAHLFGKVYTCNLPNHFESAITLNSDLNNIVYIPIDLYNSDLYESFILPPEYVSVFFIDAVHTKEAVLIDVTRSLFMRRMNPCYFIFDDYGTYPEVHSAIDDLIDVGKMEIVQYIGHEPGHDFGQGRILQDYEGVICKLIE